MNMAKQLNILLTNMDVPPKQIVIDPMTGAMGYGIEYTYSVMERIRLTGLGGDKMLASPDDRLAPARSAPRSRSSRRPKRTSRPGAI